MNEKGSRYALSALKNKRATIASEIIQLERQVRHRKDMLSHVDATLKILDPSIEIDTIPNKRLPKKVNLFRAGELGRLVRDALRQSGGEASTQGIVAYIIAAGGHGPEAKKAVGARVRSNLAYLQRRGKVSKSGNQREARWRLI